MTCTVENCDRPLRNKAGIHCSGHYSRYRRHGDVQADKPLAPARSKPLEVVDHADGTRTCAECSTRLPLATGFHRDSRGPRGHRPTCKTCRVAKETQRYNIDPEASREKSRQRRVQNLEHVRALEAQYYLKHREKRIESAIAHSHVRRARINGAAHDKGITVPQLRKRHGDECHYCGITLIFGRFKAGKRPKNLATLEHLKPIARGGTHTWDNCRLACWACNISKGARDYPQRLLLANA
jgi:5-methylcytosine-specific restriction endonuclease McrA